MIYALKGILSSIEPSDNVYILVLDCGYIQYEMKTTYTTAQQMPATGQELRLFTHLQVREDGLDLYGFITEEEKRCFLMLTSVSGVGPRAALSILSGLSPDQLALSIASGDAKSLTQCKGIGTKSAQRILLELKDQFTDLEVASGVLQKETFSAKGAASEAINALVSLGYSKTEAASAISQCPSDMKVEEMIKASLRSLSSVK